MLLFFPIELSGPRFDQFGNIIPNSILGNVDDFLALAVRTGDLAEVSLSSISALTCAEKLHFDLDT